MATTLVNLNSHSSHHSDCSTDAAGCSYVGQELTRYLGWCRRISKDLTSDVAFEAAYDFDLDFPRRVCGRSPHVGW